MIDGSAGTTDYSSGTPLTNIETRGSLTPPLEKIQRAFKRALQKPRTPLLRAVTRDRLEIALMSAAGWSAPKIAGHLGRHPRTVRAAPQGVRHTGHRGAPPRHTRSHPGPRPINCPNCSAKSEPRHRANK
ncbi:helix-turn-helix domain-containing protein [Gemmata sp. SH-PL17]|uniref:helix-turn-helix domain-containing protein n=1 Tax=Gemmata sp. SH-PL17 TaxID=1630693 RepID=UPI0009EECDEE